MARGPDQWPSAQIATPMATCSRSCCSPRRSSFAGISTKLRSSTQREVLFGLGCLIFLAAVIWAATIPVSFSL
jgi:hypothetical protein